jgi:uncharacterized membrane protein YphA (DoxX/SURF4 family)
MSVGRSRTTILLWVAQVLLAALFLFAGVVKLMMPPAVLAAQGPFPAGFLYFIAVVEVVGGIGVLLPSLLRVRPGLAPLAAAGLVLIMVGATISTMLTIGIGAALLPLVTGIVAAFVAYGRWRLAPVPERTVGDPIGVRS